MEALAKVAMPTSEARQILASASSTALALLVAVDQTFAGAFGWEPESLWLSCEQAGIALPEINAAKIQAGIALMYVPSFYWDAIVFEKTVLAFSDVLPHPGILQEATPAQMAWGVVETGRLRQRFQLDPFEFETEPKVYTATVLHRAGFALAPPELAFAQELLDRVNRGGKELRTRVAQRIAHEGAPASHHSFDETEEGVQLGYLATVKLYVDERRAQLEHELAQLT